MPACSCTHTSFCSGAEVHSLPCGLRRAWGMCSGAQSWSLLHRVCGLWWLRAWSLHGCVGTGRQQRWLWCGPDSSRSVQGGRNSPGAKSHPGAWLLPPTALLQEGVLERLLWGLEREFLHVPRPRAGRHTAGSLNVATAGALTPWALPAAASAPVTLEACLPTQHCLPRLPAFKLLPRGPRMPQASVCPMLSLSWALHPLSPPGLLPCPQQEGRSCRRARPCCLP